MRFTKKGPKGVTRLFGMMDYNAPFICASFAGVFIKITYNEALRIKYDGSTSMMMFSEQCDVEPVVFERIEVSNGQNR